MIRMGKVVTNNMETENIKLNIGRDQIQNIRMTSHEKERILKNVTSSPVSLPRPILSWAIFQYKIFYPVTACLILIFGGIGVVSASSNTLPGDLLYPVKVHIAEPLHAAFLFKTEAKAEFQTNLATKRLVEAETLSDNGKLDTNKEKELNDLLNKHTEAFHSELNNLKANNSQSNKEKEDNLSNNFQKGLEKHGQILEKLRNNRGNDIIEKSH